MHGGRTPFADAGWMLHMPYHSSAFANSGLTTTYVLTWLGLSLAPFS